MVRILVWTAADASCRQDRGKIMTRFYLIIAVIAVMTAAATASDNGDDRSERSQTAVYGTR
jgi:hypothetical protein